MKMDKGIPPGDENKSLVDQLNDDKTPDTTGKLDEPNLDSLVAAVKGSKPKKEKSVKKSSDIPLDWKRDLDGDDRINNNPKYKPLRGSSEYVKIVARYWGGSPIIIEEYTITFNRHPEDDRIYVANLPRKYAEHLIGTDKNRIQRFAIVE